MSVRDRISVGVVVRDRISVGVVVRDRISVRVDPSKHSVPTALKLGCGQLKLTPVES
jgi:hypothetical protein